MGIGKLTLPGLLYDPSRHGRPRWYVRRKIDGKWRRARLTGIDTRPPLEITDEVRAAYLTAW